MNDIFSYSSELEPAQKENISLGLCLDKKKFAYAVKSGEEILSFKITERSPASPTDIDFFEWFRENDALKKPYQKVTIVFKGNKFLLVPTELFNELQLEAYTRPFFEKPADEIIKSTEGEEFKGVFALNQKLYFAVKSKYFDAPLSHVSMMDIQRLQQKENDRESVNVFFEEGYFHLVHLEAGELSFSNHFTFVSHEEVLYHLVNFYDKKNISRERIPLRIAGLKANNSLLKKLENYFYEIEELQTSLPSELEDKEEYHSFLLAL